MKQKVPYVLGCSIGTRQIGIAVLRTGRIAHRRVSQFKGRWSSNKLQSIRGRIEKYARRYSVTAVSLKVPSRTHHTFGIKTIIAAIEEYCTSHSIRLHICNITELKAHGIVEGRSNKKVLVQALAVKYTSLHLTALKEQSLKNSYYTKMFEAIAAAELLVEQLSN